MLAALLYKKPMTPYRFDKGCPPEIRKPVSEILERHLKIVPAWCRVITVYYGATNGDLNCSTYTDYHYRFVQIYIYADWFTSKEREHDLVHELFHIVTAPAAMTAKKHLELLLADAEDSHRKAVLETHKNAVESMVEDLTTLYLSGRLSHRSKKKS